jgi:hypothetical protein
MFLARLLLRKVAKAFFCLSKAENYPSDSGIAEPQLTPCSCARSLSLTDQGLAALELSDPRLKAFPSPDKLQAKDDTPIN